MRDRHQQLALGPARKRTRAEAAAPALRAPPLTPEAQRARKASANRVLTIFKALLNKAFQDDLVTNDLAWRKVKPFHNVNQPTTRFLTAADCIRLLNVCRPDLRRLVKAALFTGARPGGAAAAAAARPGAAARRGRGAASPAAGRGRRAAAAAARRPGAAGGET